MPSFLVSQSLDETGSMTVRPDVAVDAAVKISLSKCLVPSLESTASLVVRVSVNGRPLQGVKLNAKEHNNVFCVLDADPVPHSAKSLRMLQNGTAGVPYLASDAVYQGWTGVDGQNCVHVRDLTLQFLRTRLGGGEGGDADLVPLDTRCVTLTLAPQGEALIPAERSTSSFLKVREEDLVEYDGTVAILGTGASVQARAQFHAISGMTIIPRGFGRRGLRAISRTGVRTGWGKLNGNEMMAHVDVVHALSEHLGFESVKYDYTGYAGAEAVINLLASMPVPEGGPIAMTDADFQPTEYQLGFDFTASSVGYGTTYADAGSDGVDSVDFVWRSESNRMPFVYDWSMVGLVDGDAMFDGPSVSRVRKMPPVQTAPAFEGTVRVPRGTVRRTGKLRRDAAGKPMHGFYYFDDDFGTIGAEGAAVLEWGGNWASAHTVGAAWPKDPTWATNWDIGFDGEPAGAPCILRTDMEAGMDVVYVVVWSRQGPGSEPAELRVFVDDEAEPVILRKMPYAAGVPKYAHRAGTLPAVYHIAALERNETRATGHLTPSGGFYERLGMAGDVVPGPYHREQILHGRKFAFHFDGMSRGTCLIHASFPDVTVNEPGAVLLAGPDATGESDMTRLFQVPGGREGQLLLANTESTEGQDVARLTLGTPSPAVFAHHFTILDAGLPGMHLPSLPNRGVDWRAMPEISTRSIHYNDASGDDGASGRPLALDPNLYTTIQRIDYYDHSSPELLRLEPRWSARDTERGVDPSRLLHGVILRVSPEDVRDYQGDQTRTPYLDANGQPVFVLIARIGGAEIWCRRIKEATHESEFPTAFQGREVLKFYVVTVAYKTVVSPYRFDANGEIQSGDGTTLVPERVEDVWGSAHTSTRLGYAGGAAVEGFCIDLGSIDGNEQPTDPLIVGLMWGPFDDSSSGSVRDLYTSFLAGSATSATPADIKAPQGPIGVPPWPENFYVPGSSTDRVRDAAHMPFGGESHEWVFTDSKGHLCVMETFSAQVPSGDSSGGYMTVAAATSLLKERIELYRPFAADGLAAVAKHAALQGVRDTQAERLTTVRPSVRDSFWPTIPTEDFDQVSGKHVVRW